MMCAWVVMEQSEVIVYPSEDPKPRTAKLVMLDVVISALCGLSVVCTIISVVTKKAWISNQFSVIERQQWAIYDVGESNSINVLLWLGTGCTLVAFLVSILRIRFEAIESSRQCRTCQFCCMIISFISLLSSVAIWADVLRHTHPQHPTSSITQRRLTNNDLEDPHDGRRNLVSELGWAYWLCVTAVLSLFLSILLHLMRKDCQPSEPTYGENGQ